jgi:GTPase SAR1 family protein
MSLDIIEEQNPTMSVQVSKMNLDGLLATDFPEDWVLPKMSGFYLLIVGSPGSGKTTLLNSIITSRHKKGVRRSYRKVFDKILLVSPTLGTGTSSSKDEFKKLPNGQKWKTLDYSVLDKVETMAKEGREDNEHTLLIMDDVGAELRKSADIEKKLQTMLNNRRHMNLSVIILLQRFRDANPSMRTSLSHFITFRPKSIPELERISTELLPFKKNHYLEIFNYVFDEDKYAFLYIDMSLRETNKFILYKKYNKLTITDPVNNIIN